MKYHTTVSDIIGKLEKYMKGILTSLVILICMACGNNFDIEGYIGYDGFNEVLDASIDFSDASEDPSADVESENVDISIEECIPSTIEVGGSCNLVEECGCPPAS